VVSSMRHVCGTCWFPGNIWISKTSIIPGRMPGWETGAVLPAPAESREHLRPCSSGLRVGGSEPRMEPW
jgi:hypothetical protein